ncbi:MAG: hypothetical protein RLY71_4383 [Pseudomonadota bacterium]
MKFLPLLCLILASTCVFADEPSVETSAAASSEREQQRLLLDKGTSLLKARRPAEAIELFDAIINYYERDARGSAKTYSARTQTETLAYMLMAAKANVDAVTVSATFGYAYYLKSYALTELQQTSAAEDALMKAIELSPHNAHFLAERGNQLAVKRSWIDSLSTFKRAEVAARSFSPELLHTAEIGRALRGQGFVLVELDRLPEAERIYEECLALNREDRIATAELAFIRARIAKGVK